MFRISLLIPWWIVVITVINAQIAPTYHPEYHNAANLTFAKKELQCVIQNRGGAMFQPEDCYVFLYINNKAVSRVNGKMVKHRYTALLRATVRCEAECEHDGYKEAVKPMEIVINETVFYAMMVGVGVVLLLLVIAVVCGIKHCRGHYYYNKLDQQQQDAESLKQETAA